MICPLPFLYQDAEKARQHRSRIVQTLNVPLRVRLGPSLAAALLNGLFEHPDLYDISAVLRYFTGVFPINQVLPQPAM
jgi:hypothetical protein